ncbi:MAG TPA: hypothetical protein VH475_26315 [Tepidisphaeraceae bacterium]|jgi:hypothetical protein
MADIKVNPESDQFVPVQEHTPVQTANNSGVNFGKVLGGAANIAGQLVSGVAGAQTLGLGPLVGNIAGSLAGGNGVSGGPLDGSELTNLLQLQNEIQRQSLVFNAQTNISKTDHETRMSAVRNIRT